MSFISTSLTVRARGQPSPRFHVEAWLLFRNCEMDDYVFCLFFLLYILGFENVGVFISNFVELALHLAYSSFFSFLVFMARTLRAWAIKGRKTRSITCRTDLALG